MAQGLGARAGSPCDSPQSHVSLCVVPAPRGYTACLQSSLLLPSTSPKVIPKTAPGAVPLLGPSSPWAQGPMPPPGCQVPSHHPAVPAPGLPAKVPALQGRYLLRSHGSTRRRLLSALDPWGLGWHEPLWMWVHRDASQEPSQGCPVFCWLFLAAKEVRGLSATTGGCRGSSHCRRWAAALFSGKHYEFLKL